MTLQKSSKHENVGKYIICGPEKCTGCELCVYVCSFKHAKSFGSKKSMIQVAHFHPLLHIAVACQHCKDPDCVRVCPTEALSQSEETGVIQVDQEKCTGCGWCAEACPYGAMDLDADTLIAFTCDLCEGEEQPACIESCPGEALEKGNLKTFREKVNDYIEKHQLSEYPEMKRWLNEKK